MLTEFRESVAQALIDGDVAALDYVAELITPPFAAVVPADPYVAPGGPGTDLPFGMSRVSVDVLLVSGLMTAKAQATAMDELLVKALAALDDFDTGDVTRPGVITLEGAKFLASTIRVTADMRL